MEQTDLPDADAWADTKNHTHEWKMTWGLAFADWRQNPPTLWERFKHTGKHSHGVAKGASTTNGNWMNQWRAYKKWLPKHIRRLATEGSRMLKDIESFGGTKAVWCL
jgi:hypothetical protein